MCCNAFGRPTVARYSYNEWDEEEQQEQEGCDLYRETNPLPRYFCEEIVGSDTKRCEYVILFYRIEVGHFDFESVIVFYVIQGMFSGA